MRNRMQHPKVKIVGASKPRPVGQWFQIVHGQGGGGRMSVINSRLSPPPPPPHPLLGQEPIHLAQQIMLCDTGNKQTIK
jgi:hypothetical protein